MSHELSKQSISERLLTEWARELAPATRKTYEEGLREFASFMECPDVLTALNRFFSLDQGGAFEIGQRWKNWLKDRHAVNAVNLRISTLKSIVAQVHAAGRIPWTLKIKSEKSQQYKDTRGPGEDGVQKLVDAAKNQTPAMAARDIAIIQLLFGEALRRESVAQLDFEDLSETGHAMIHRKGYREKIERSLGKETCDAINKWLDYRGVQNGPLFWPMSANGMFKRGVRLTGKTGIYPIIKRLAKKAGIDTRPHGLRHAGTTAALDRTNGNVRAVAKFTGHKDINVVLRYDDNRKDVEREISDLVSRRKTDDRSSG